VISRAYACPTIPAIGQLSDNADTRPGASEYLARGPRSREVLR